MTGLVDEILGEQAASGAFRSSVVLPDGAVVTDENCFVTALVALELLTLARDQAGIRHAIEGAIDFIGCCADAALPGAFRFYPLHGATPRLDIPLPADLDDTVLASMLLLRAGHRAAEQIGPPIRDLARAVRIRSRRGDEPPWVVGGLAATWLGTAQIDNPIDLVVNANLLALEALLRCDDDTAHHRACTAINEAVRMTTGGARWQRLLAPYYADPLELRYALERATNFGVDRLLPARDVLRAQSWAEKDAEGAYPRFRPICCDAGGEPIWIAPALQAARQLAAATICVP